MALDPVLDVWLQQAKETGVAYKAFTVYRDFQPHERTLVKTAAFLKKDSSTIEKWSSRWSWVRRSREYDIEKERVMLVANLAEIHGMRQKQAEDASTQSRALTAPADALLLELEKDPDLFANAIRNEKGEVVHSRLVELVGMVVSSARVLPALTDVERLARGEPTQITDHRVTDGRMIADEIFKDPETRRKALELQEAMFGITDVPPLRLGNGKKK